MTHQRIDPAILAAVRSKPKKSKYGNVKVKIDGISFDSKAEGERYGLLKLLDRGGVIEALELQPKYDCIVNGVHVASYRPDFRYRHVETGDTVIEDVKGKEPDAMRIRRILTEALFDIEVRVVNGKGQPLKIKPRKGRKRGKAKC
ncbi:MAG: DUF1064 domain-containing protein [Henriciella sp.]|nr:DUF1064 domain-containing protein [Henriciella sp.]